MENGGAEVFITCGVQGCREGVYKHDVLVSGVVGVFLGGKMMTVNIISRSSAIVSNGHKVVNCSVDEKDNTQKSLQHSRKCTQHTHAPPCTHA